MGGFRLKLAQESRTDSDANVRWEALLVRIPAESFAMNGVVTWVFGPDGSKGGWPDSNTGDELREKFLTAARATLGAKVVDLSYGEFGVRTVSVEDD
jgi:hypothetical protein